MIGDVVGVIDAIGVIETIGSIGSIVSIEISVVIDLLVSFFQLFDCTTKLVGARCRLGAAANAVEASNDVVVGHAFNQCADALKIAVATSVEFHIDNAPFAARQFDDARAGALCLVDYFFHKKSSQLVIVVCKVTLLI